MKAVDKFHISLENSYSTGLFLGGYKTSFPSDFLATSNTTNNAHWFWDEDNETYDSLTAYAACDEADKAYFSPSKTVLCFGYDSQEPSVFFAQDNTIIYHEMGHAFHKILLNVRNVDADLPASSELGYLFYDEAGSIGEGLADFQSFAMNERTHFAEWGLGRFINQSRPMDEDDPLHAPGIAADKDSRLSYPAYLLYDPNYPDKPIEDVHYAGQIISHFMVALTKDLSSQCGWTMANAINATNYLIYESFVELGDLTAKASDGTANYVNLSSDHALTWSRVANPVNMRKFVQTLSKFLLEIYGRDGSDYGNPPRTSCNGTNYDMDTYEQLVDSYGLLLFKNYNEDGGSLLTGNSGTNTTITEANKVKTVTVTKDHLIFDPTQNASKAFVFDNREAIAAAIKTLDNSGQINDISTLIDSSLPYNNGNISISPGEIVGLSLNLYNNSNSPIAGVQVLGNDWDHGKDGKPCGNFEDGFPTSSEGAADLTGDTGAAAGCNYITRDNGDDAGESIEPVCMVQTTGSSAAKWVFQDELKESLFPGGDGSKCLGGTLGNDKECFVRTIVGANQSTYSMMNPKTTWSKTVFPDGVDVKFNYNNLIFMEISPWVPPGTTFNCRFRARFTNCEDCYSDPDNADGDDFRDFEYSGADPFKIINFEFIVID